MQFIGQSDFNHRITPKIGVLVTNLGTPAAPTKKALRTYLKQFLSDSRVIEIPKPIWWFILNGIILNTRPAKSAKLYQSIWTERGSPLAWHTADQAQAIEQKLNAMLSNTENTNTELIVQYAMRYGEPSIKSTLEKMQLEGAEKIIVLPLYPQYAGSSSGSTFDAVTSHLQQSRWVPNFRFINSYHDNPQYIAACANQIQTYWKQHGKAQKLLFSFHGLPKFHLEKGDPYFCQCHKTVKLLAEALKLKETDYLITFQSRFGRTEWLKPYTDATLKTLPEQGVKKLDIFCPGFSADCLETLEEIAVENKKYFMDAGGEEYRYIPALNTAPEHIHALSNIIYQNISDWLTTPQRDPELSEKRYNAIKKDS